MAEAFVKFIPALSGAVAAYLAVKFLFFWNDTFSVELMGFIVVFCVVYFIVDAAMRQYGQK
jgi:TctA family transporter